jgi:hypothetical protein
MLALLAALAFGATQALAFDNSRYDNVSIIIISTLVRPLMSPLARGVLGSEQVIFCALSVTLHIANVVQVMEQPTPPTLRTTRRRFPTTAR